MRIFYLTPALLAYLFFIGCSSTYRVSDFTSKDEFIKDFNSSAKDKLLKVFLNHSSLIGDSIFMSEKGAYISNDSLVCTWESLMEEYTLRKEEVKEIIYSVHDRSNTIFLNNGNSLRAKEIQKSDSLIYLFNFNKISSHIPLSGIKEISFKNHWFGILDGFLIGLAVSLVSDALLIYIIPNDLNGSVPTNIVAIVTLPSALTGITIFISAIGGIWGGISGYSYTYQFNP
jgi:hypothetical protein